MKIIILLTLIIGLSGCVTPVSQMLDNQFLNIQLTEPKNTGIWTGALGGGLVTLELKNDGTGVMCEDMGSSVRVYQLRNSNNLIYAQNGISFQVDISSADLLVLKTTNSAFNTKMNFKGDNNLNLASPRCKSEL